MNVMGSLKRTYAGWCGKNHVAAWTMSALLVLAAVSVILGIATFGYTFSNMLFINRKVYWGDFFDSVYYSYESPYTVARVLYPPLITVIYALIADFLIPRVGGYTPYEPGTYADHSELYSYVLRDSALGTTVYLVFTAIGLILLFVLVWKILKSRGFKLNLWLFSLLAVLSYPFMFAIDRGNCILFVALFCLYFVYGYESENRAVRWSAYLSLAVAAAIKVYPIFFLALFFRNRNWKGLIASAVLSVFLLLFPFVFTDGSPSVLLDTMVSHTSNAAGSNGLINLQDWVNLLGYFLSDGAVTAISAAVVIAFELLTLYLIATRKDMKEWEVLMLASAMIIYGPGVGAAYLLTFVLIPLLYFVTEEKELDRRNLFFAFCLVAAMCLFPWIDALHTMLASIKAMLLLIMVLVIILDQFPRGREFLARFGMFPGQVADKNARAQTN